MFAVIKVRVLSPPAPISALPLLQFESMFPAFVVQNFMLKICLSCLNLLKNMPNLFSYQTANLTPIPHPFDASDMFQL